MYRGFVAADPHVDEFAIHGRRRAIFVDRDGTINAMFRNAATGTIDSPMGPEEFELLPGAVQALRAFNDLGFSVIVVSNQPVVAKGKTTIERVEATTRKLLEAASSYGARIDDVFYCLHHPQSILPELRLACVCRKPRAGLLRQAAAKHEIDLASSYMVGDSLTDVQAGHAAACRTVWLTPHDAVVPMDEHLNASPHHRAAALIDAARIIADVEQRRQISAARIDFGSRSGGSAR
ncbi:MAG: HAD family hydrolase [Chloroflexota bacterium]|nr:MAG: HAD family hydrolase [Chloroflexota bacterium]